MSSIEVFFRLQNLKLLDSLKENNTKIQNKQNRMLTEGTSKKKISTRNLNQVFVDLIIHAPLQKKAIIHVFLPFS